MLNLNLLVVHSKLRDGILHSIDQEDDRYAICTFFRKRSMEPQKLRVELNSLYLPMEDVSLGELYQRECQKHDEYLQSLQMEVLSSERVYLHPRMGRVTIIGESRDECGNNVYEVRLENESGLDSIILDPSRQIKFELEDDEVDSRNITYSTRLRTAIVYPCELIDITSLKAQFQARRDKKLYTTYSDASFQNETMYTLDELVYVLADLPRAPKLDAFGRTQYRKVTKNVNLPDGTVAKQTVDSVIMQAPKVVVMGEASGRIFITDAWLLHSVECSKANPTNGDTRYRWADPATQKVAVDTPEVYNYVPADDYYSFSEESYSFQEETSEVEAEEEESTPAVTVVKTGSHAEKGSESVMRFVNSEAHYWQSEEPLPTAKDLGFTALSWEPKNLKPSVGDVVAKVSLIHQGQKYLVPVHLKEKGLLEVRVNISQRAKDLLCRYVSFKVAELRAKNEVSLKGLRRG